MNNPYEAGDPGTQIISSSPSMSLATIEPIVVGVPTTRAERKIAHRAHMDATIEYHKARVTNTVICNAVALSAVVDAAAAIVPSSEPLCREAVKISILSSANRIAERWSQI